MWKKYLSFHCFLYNGKYFLNMYPVCKFLVAGSESMDTARGKGMARCRTTRRLQQKQDHPMAHHRRKRRENINYKIRIRPSIPKKSFHISWRKRSNIPFLPPWTRRSLQSPGSVLPTKGYLHLLRYRTCCNQSLRWPSHLW